MQISADFTASKPRPRLWHRRRVTDGKPSLYDVLMSIKPDNLTPNLWASRAGVSRSFWRDLRKGSNPRTDTLEKILRQIDHTPAQFWDLVASFNPNVALAALGTSSVALPFRRGDERNDVPVPGTAQASDMRIEEGGEVRFVERMSLDMENTYEYARRPASLVGRQDVYCIRVVGDSAADRYMDGDPAYVDPRRQPQRGDWVVVQLLKRDEEHEDASLHIALLKRLVRRGSTYIELEQTNPQLTFTIPMNEVHAVHRVIPWDELVFF